MELANKIILENVGKHIISLMIALYFWDIIFEQISLADEQLLSSIAVIITLIALASLTAYFTFSFSIVGKDFKWRLAGYLYTFLLFLSFTLSLEVILATAINWVPNLSVVWTLIVVSLFVGALIFDHLDLMKLGLDPAAIHFFEKGHGHFKKTK